MWIELETTRKRGNVVIVLPSDVAVGQFHLLIVEKGLELELPVRWPTTLRDSTLLHKKLLISVGAASMETYYLKFIGFQKAFKNFRENISGQIESEDRITFPTCVEIHIDSKYNLAGKDDSSRTVHVYLKS